MEQKIDQVMLALMEVHKEFGVTIGKDKRGNRATYASLPLVLETISDMCLKHGLILVQEPTIIEGNRMALVTLLSHPKSGQYRRSMSLLPDHSDAQNQEQAYGGSTTYHRRYDAMMMVGIFCSDDPTDHDGDKTPEKKQDVINEKQLGLLKSKIGERKELETKIINGLKIKDLKDIPWKQFNSVLEYVDAQLGNNNK